MSRSRGPAATLITLAGIIGLAFPVAAAEAVDVTTCAAEVEPNDSLPDATAIGPAGCVSGTLVSADDTDIFLWQVDVAAADTSWSVELTGPAVDVVEARVVRVDPGTDGTSAVLGDEIAGVQTDPELVAGSAGAQVSAGAEFSLDAGEHALVVRRGAGSSDGVDEADYELRITKVEQVAPATAMPETEATAHLAVATAGGSLPQLGAGAAVELVLDTSGSMLERLDARETKLAAAQKSLTGLVDHLPGGLPVALRTFKAQPRSCATVLRIPLGPLEQKAMKRTIDEIPARKGTRTPIAKAVTRAAEDLASFDGHRMLVLVTDGKEDCGGDPAAAVERLVESDGTAVVHVIGFALPDDPSVPEALADWAALGGGRYIEAADRASLSAALDVAFTAPYLVFDAAGSLVAQGTVGDEGVDLEAGAYRVEILTDPPATFEAVDLTAGGARELWVQP